MAIPDNVIDFRRHRESSLNETVDDICAQAYLLLRDEALSHGVPLKTLFVEHMLGMMLVVKEVEGEAEAQQLLKRVSDKIAQSV